MPNDDSGGLLSKETKFVRDPLKDWPTEPVEPSAPTESYSREMLKQMIERRQRNDYVRRREFAMLRKMRQEKQATANVNSPPSSFNQNNPPGRSDGRALTLKKIDKIEAQMSQQWWNSHASAALDSSSSPPDAALAPAPAPQRQRTYADTLPGSIAVLPLSASGARRAPHLPSAVINATADRGADTAAGGYPSRLLVNTSIEEAAICLARGDDAGCEAVLLQTISAGNPGADHDDSWRTLLDLYRATDNIEKFERVRSRYIQRFGRLSMGWISLRLVASDALATQASPGGSTGTPAVTAQASAILTDGWSSAAVLTREGLDELARVLGAAGPVWQLDWRALERIDPVAVSPLRSLFAQWGNSPIQLCFIGADTLLDVLVSATAANSPATPAIWWELRMCVLRVMHQADVFEQVALDYCLIYEVSPQPWEKPQCAFTSADAPLRRTGSVSARAPSLDRHPLLSASDARTGTKAVSARSPGADPSATQPASLPPRFAMLAGNLSGKCESIWRGLDADLAGTGTSVISCAALLRMDFVAAGELLQWVVARNSRGDRIEFIDAHRLLVAFFKVVGIADHANVMARRD